VLVRASNSAIRMRHVSYRGVNNIALGRRHNTVSSGSMRWASEMHCSGSCGDVWGLTAGVLQLENDRLKQVSWCILIQAYAVPQS
jgi:hypothetical protein